jgi:hypothetical protein
MSISHVLLSHHHTCRVLSSAWLTLEVQVHMWMAPAGHSSSSGEATHVVATKHSECNIKLSYACKLLWPVSGSDTWQ